MKLNEIPRKRLSSSELSSLFEDLVKHLKVRTEADRKVFGWPFKALLSHVRWLEAEIDRITQEKFSMTTNEERAVAPPVKPSNLSVGRVTHAFPPSAQAVHSSTGERAYYALITSDEIVEKLLRWGKIKSRDELKALANEWADKNKKETLT